MLGHAFSPFLRGRGGEALACTFGVWTALTGAAGTVALGATIAVLVSVFDLGSEGWPIIGGLLGLGAFLAATTQPAPVLVAWLGTVLLAVERYRTKLPVPFTVRLRPRVRALVARVRSQG